MAARVTIYTFADGGMRVVLGEHIRHDLTAGNGDFVRREFESALHALNMLPPGHSAIPMLKRISGGCAECD